MNVDSENSDEEEGAAGLSAHEAHAWRAIFAQMLGFPETSVQAEIRNRKLRCRTTRSRGGVDVTALYKPRWFHIKNGGVHVVSGVRFHSTEIHHRMFLSIDVSEMNTQYQGDVLHLPVVHYIRSMYDLWLEHTRAWYTANREQMQERDAIHFEVLFRDATEYRETSPLVQTLQRTLRNVLAREHTEIETYPISNSVDVRVWGPATNPRRYYKTQFLRFIRVSAEIRDQTGAIRYARRSVEAHPDTDDKPLHRLFLARWVQGSGAVRTETWSMRLGRFLAYDEPSEIRDHPRALRTFLFLREVWIEALLESGATGIHESSVERLSDQPSIRDFFRDRFPEHSYDYLNWKYTVTGRLDAHRRGLAAPVLRARTAEDMVKLIGEYL